VDIVADLIRLQIVSIIPVSRGPSPIQFTLPNDFVAAALAV